VQQNGVKKMAMSEGDRLAYQEEITALRIVIKELAHEIHRLDGILYPGWMEEDRIKKAVKETYGSEAKDAGFVLNGAIERKPLFAEWMDLIVQWGPTRKERKDLSQRMRAYERQVDTINNMLAREAKRGKKSAA
jgi:hypothetical protein